MVKATFFDGLFLHGSRCRGIREFELKQADKNTPFGPAVYLTRDMLVASCYSRQEGSIYHVKYVGDSRRVINLDKIVGEQTEEAKQRILKLSKIHYKDANILRLNAHEAIYRDEESSKAPINAFLRTAGIGMIYGHLSGMENSGLKDRGIQYAVLAPALCRIVQEEADRG